MAFIGEDDILVLEKETGRSGGAL